MSIRLAKECDAEQLLVILNQVLEIHANLRPDIFKSGTTKYTLEELHELIKDPTFLIYVYEKDNSILGYIFARIYITNNKNMLTHKIMYIDDYCVDENHRNKGIGKELFAYVKQVAKSMDCYEITLNVWEGNSSAKKFYESLGLKPKETMMELIINEDK